MTGAKMTNRTVARRVSAAVTNGLFLAVLAACGTDGTASTLAARDEPSPSATSTNEPCVIEGSSNEPNRFNKIEELADASYSVVEGTVVAKGPGKDEGESTNLLYTVRTQAVLAGADLPPEWPYVAASYRSDGCEISFDGAGIMQVGESAIFFISAPDDTGLYRTLSASQSRYKFDKADPEKLAQTKRTDTLAREVEAGTVKDLKEKVKKSKKARSG